MLSLLLQEPFNFLDWSLLALCEAKILGNSIFKG